MLKTKDFLKVLLLVCASFCHLCKAGCYRYHLPRGYQPISSLDFVWYPTGSVVRFKCKEGYDFVGKGSTSLSAVCSANGTWVFQGRCEQNCGATEINVTGMSQGVLKSPGYPKGYRSNLYCTYKIVTYDANHRIRLEFKDFSLRPPSGYQKQCLDYVDLDNKYYASGTTYFCSTFSHCVFCGSTAPDIAYSDDNFITVIFKTGQSPGAYKGWSAVWYNERITMTSGGDSFDGGTIQPDEGTSQPDYNFNDNTDVERDSNGDVMHGTTIFLLVFLPVLAVFGVAFSYLRWKGWMAVFRVRSNRLVRNGLIASEVGPAVEEPVHILNSTNRFGPRLPGYTEMSAPLEPPPPYDAQDENSTESPATSSDTVPPPSYDSCAATADSPNENTLSSGESNVEQASAESTDPVVHVVVQN